METPAHDQNVTHRYTVHYPDHEPRESDPHYRDFNAYRRRTKDAAQCAIGAHRADFSECSLDKPLELHHAHIEFKMGLTLNGWRLTTLACLTLQQLAHGLNRQITLFGFAKPIIAELAAFTSQQLVTLRRKNMSAILLVALPKPKNRQSYGISK